MTGDDTSVLIDLYRETNTPADSLPYTDRFEQLCQKFRVRTGQPLEQHELWKQLCRLRKKKLLPRLRR